MQWIGICYLGQIIRENEGAKILICVWRSSLGAGRSSVGQTMGQWRLWRLGSGERPLQGRSWEEYVTDQAEDVDKAFKHLKNISVSPRAVQWDTSCHQDFWSVWGINCWNRCWMGQPDTGSGTQLDMLFTVKEELFGNVVITSSFGCSHREMVDCKILREVRKESIRG